ncbi:hypothetical protein AOQ84DRAFT_48878 [Glonium stellatum]|uniref:Uncharacterized protein n=1 Tax=Glonium stellatum TaxID=574774 RepID=A0A8E2JZB5_9PEZI|nr:hypothetical protein AOQ84DRAFT_48878 [Glonium stellatum]
MVVQNHDAVPLKSRGGLVDDHNLQVKREFLFVDDGFNHARFRRHRNGALRARQCSCVI